MTPARRTRKLGSKKSKLNRNIAESSEEESSDTGSVTRCICGEAHNSGLMVQCDKCEVWQHCECIGLIQEKLPDHYYCDQCQPENHQLIKTPNGRSKRLYTPWLSNNNNTSTVNGSNSDHVIIAPIKRRKTTQTESSTSDEIIRKAESSPVEKSSPTEKLVEEMESLFVIEERLTRSRRTTSTTTTTTSSTTTTSTTSTSTATTTATTIKPAAAADEEEVVQPPKKKKRAVSSSPSPNTNNEKKPKLNHNKSAPVPQVVYMEEFGSPVSTNNLPSPYWNYTDGKPTRESSPPARVKYPNSKMTFHEMNRRAKQILDCVSKIQVDELKKPIDPQQDFGLSRQRSLSTSSSSSLSSASTVPLLDDYTTCVSSPSTPIPFIPKHDESSFEILDRVNRELSKFQRKFGIVYQPQHYLRGSPIHSSNNNNNKK